MKTLRFDVAIIGAGTAGLAAYSAATAAGAHVALIEGGDPGTTCARVGCMPSKLLIAAADAAHAIGQAPRFGVHVDGARRIDGFEVMDRVRRERDRFVGGVLQDMRDIPAASRLRGHACFIDNHTLAVGDHVRVTSKSIVIATGSRPSRPEPMRAIGDRLITNDELFNWRALPSAVAVIGSGIVGLELGQALHRLGVHVVVLGRGGGIGPLGDAEIIGYANRSFNQEFILDADARDVSMERVADRVEIRRTLADGVERTELFDYVLVATGRLPNVTQMDLDQTTLKLDAKGVPLFDPATTRTMSSDGESPIFIAGDASNFIPLLHEATDEGRIAGANAAALAAGRPVSRGLRRAPLGIVFTDPQIAVVGGGFRALRPGGFATGQASFENQGRARILLRNKGLLNLYGDSASGRFLGAEMLAPAAEHLAHLLAWALQNEMTVAQMLAMPFYHPVVEEALRTALHDLAGKLHAA